jgi:uncharacterized protein (DUF1499 family)
MNIPKKNPGWRKAWRIMIFLPALLLILVVIAFMVLGHVSQTRPGHLGIREGKLAPLAPTPNGVSSQSPDAAHFIEPLRHSNSAAPAMARLKKALSQQPRGTLIKETDHYLHLEFRSPLFRFVDDVEFLIEDQVIQVRAAARVGRSDLGVNRKRIESLRACFNNLPP